MNNLDKDYQILLEYILGNGVEKNIEKSLEFAIKANELSKTNKYSKIISTKENGGLYENLIIRIENEINNMYN